MRRILSIATNVSFMLAFLWAGAAQSQVCQRGIAAANPDNAYIDHGDGTVTDTRTGLMWAKCLNGTSAQSATKRGFRPHLIVS
jgi:Spy/CpxP family protein refolding chaperone